jgi:acyl-CoA dehydrogenase
MDFGYDARTLDLRKRLLAFMEEQVYPAEAVFEAQVAAAVQQGKLWERAPVTTELKAEARSRGLWNLFLTGKAAAAVGKLDDTYLPDPPLTNLQYAPLAEIAGCLRH